MDLRVIVYQRSLAALTPLLMPRVHLIPTSYSWHAIGGPERAEIAVAAGQPDIWECLEWLRCPVEIVDSRAECVWWGYMAEVEVRVGTVTVGLSLDSMANRVAAVYGGGIDGSWHEDADSIATYGYKELLETVTENDATPADNQATLVLAAKRYPVPTVSLGEPGEMTAKLVCQGWWQTLGWRYYQNLTGGATVTTTQIGAIVTASGQFLASTEITDASGLTGDAYREGTSTALDVIERLLQAGVSGGRRLLAKVERTRNLVIYQEPASGTDDYLMTVDGRISSRYGVMMDPHRCPVAIWVRLKDVIPASVDTTRMADPALVFVERSEYNVERGQLTLEPRGVPSPWETVEIEE